MKVFFSTMLMFMRTMYGEYLEESDYKELQEDLAKLILNLILKDDVIKVLVCLIRIDCFDSDKDLRNKFSMLKGVQTTDFGVDPYLSMNDASVFFKEASKKFGVDLSISHQTPGGVDHSMNTTVQIDVNLNDHEIGNIGFKEYLTENKHLLNLLPPAAR